MKTTILSLTNNAGNILLTKALLFSGILASLLFIGTDIMAAMQWEDYSYTDQSVSELRAVGAPTRAFLIPLLLLYAVLEIAFGVGVMNNGRQNRLLRITGYLLMGLGVVDLIAPLFPMHIGGTMKGDMMHLIATAVTVIMILLIIGFGGAAIGKWFRIYSIATILTVLLFGILAGTGAHGIEEHLPTPWLGVEERINIYGYMLWMLALAIVLLRKGKDA